MLGVISGCTTAEPTPEIDPTALITEAATNIRTSETFRIRVERTGAPYFVETDLGSVAFRLANAQYIAPAIMQATVRLVTAGLTADVDIFSRGAEQWYRHGLLTGNQWFNAPFAPGFNPQTLIAEDTGFQAALAALIELRYVGAEALEDGTPVHHLSGMADGADVSALMVNLIEASGNVEVQVYIDRERLIPVRFVIVQPDSVTEDEVEPTTWTVDIFDVNEAILLEDAPESALP
jgi:hypothetical protein